jgi:Sulfotransferase family
MRTVMAGRTDADDLFARIEAGAARRTGIREPADGDIRDGMRVLLAAFAGLEDLTRLGWLGTRAEIGRRLANSLRLRQVLRENPGIEGMAVCSPVVILGLPRTGTTLLHHLLACAHRDPPTAMASWCNLVKTVQLFHLRRLDPWRIGQDWRRIWSEGADKALRTRTGAKPGHFLDVSYSALTSDPLTTTQSLLFQLGISPGPDFKHHAEGVLRRLASRRGGASFTRRGLRHRSRVEERPHSRAWLIFRVRSTRSVMCTPSKPKMALCIKS